MHAYYLLQVSALLYFVEEYISRNFKKNNNKKPTNEGAGWALNFP